MASDHPDRFDRFSDTQTAFMRRALTLAAAQLGRTAPNPAVGCVVVRDGEVVGEGATADGGRPHAETIALKAAGEQARGADIYVSLEPCAHVGQTPPCAQALIDAEVGAVVVACRDLDRRVGGRGVAMLKEAGIVVKEGLLSSEALDLNEGFFKRVMTGMPLLGLSQSGEGYDAPLSVEAGEAIGAALTRAGGQGMTRVFLRPGDPAAERALADRLIDVLPDNH